MKKITIAIFALCASLAHGLTLNIGVDGLRDDTGAFASTTSLTMIVVDIAGGGFDDPIRSPFTTGVGDTINDGDWQIVWKGDLQTNAVEGLFFEPVQITLTPETTDKAIAIVWFPEETLAAGAIEAGAVYGTYTSTNGTQYDSDHDWSTGTNNAATYTINAIGKNNTTGTPYIGGLEDALLTASKETIPEPSACAALMGLGALLLVVRRRK